MSDPERTLESYFADWEGEAFGFGYGTGEEHILAALKTFFATVGKDEPEDRHGCGGGSMIPVCFSTPTR